MSDNAKIQFTIKFDDIPKEVSKKLHDNAIRFEQASNIVDIITDSISKKDIQDTILNIETLRKDLNFIDMIFEDCYNILIGYSTHQSRMLQKRLEEAKTLPQEKEEENADDRQI